MMWLGQVGRQGTGEEKGRSQWGQRMGGAWSGANLVIISYRHCSALVVWQRSIARLRCR